MTFRREKDLQEKVRDAIIKRYGSEIWYYHSRSMLQKDSIDIILCFKGYFIGIELKKDLLVKGPTKMQQYNLNRIKKAKGATIVADSVQQVLSNLLYFERNLILLEFWQAKGKELCQMKEE